MEKKGRKQTMPQMRLRRAQLIELGDWAAVLRIESRMRKLAAK
jgi:hypothetical protein